MGQHLAINLHVHLTLRSARRSGDLADYWYLPLRDDEMTVLVVKFTDRRIPSLWLVGLEGGRETLGEYNRNIRNSLTVQLPLDGGGESSCGWLSG